MMTPYHCFSGVRLKYSEELVKGTMKRLTQGLTEHNKKLTAAKTEEAKADVVSFRGLGLGVIVLVDHIYP